MARQLASSMSEELRAACNNDHLKEALQILNTINQSAFVDSSVYTSLLHGCVKEKALADGKLVHAHMAQTGFQADVFIENTLLNMYAKSGFLMEARRIFDHMAERSVVSWTMMITAYVTHRLPTEALTLFRQMQQARIKPNNFTFSSVLPACAAIQHGRQIHKEIIKSCWYQSDVVVGNALLVMYSKCGKLEEARKVFDRMCQRNVVSWNAMIAGYAQNDNFNDAEELFKEMPRRDVVSWTIMITGYARNGYVDEALKLFMAMPERDAVSWNAIIAGYAQNGYGEEAINLYKQMQSVKVRPNSETFASVLSACADLSDLEQGEKIHVDVCKHGSQTDAFVGSALVDMYAKCRSIDDACEVFGNILRRDVILCNAMVAAYSKNGDIEKAHHLFQTMPERDASSWNAMIGGYAQNGYCEEALKLYGQMQLTGAKPNPETLATVLSACANSEALEQGKEVHADIIRSGFQWELFVGSALIDMYAKCGSIKNAREVFSQMPQHDVVSWNAMIAGYAMHGFGKEALNLFDQMLHCGTYPDHVTFIGVLSACCHSGLVDEGLQYFNCMSNYYQITPTMEHYACMVDLLGRAGHLDKAQNFINRMTIKPDYIVWSSLIAACRIHKNIKLGEFAAERLIELNRQKATPYVALSNIYAAVGRWDGIEKVRKMMKDEGVRKEPGCSWIEINKQVHTFFVGDRSHPNLQQIYEKLEILSQQMKAAGYAPQRRLELNDVE